MYSWGRRSIEACEDSGEGLARPHNVTAFDGQVQQIGVHQSGCVVLLSDGSVYNFLNQFPSASSSKKVTALDTVTVIDVCAGDGFILVIDDKYRVFAWGRNKEGQLGLPECDHYTSPKQVKALQNYQVVSVACGKSHSLFLTSSGDLFACGNNEFGQLGLGLDVSRCSDVVQIKSLEGIPFAQIAAGYWHSLAVSLSGAVFGWGRNDFGQLGVGDDGNRNNPTLLRSLRSQIVKFVSAGGLHTVALTADGGIFAFGSNECGQLGHGKSPQMCVSPVKVFELMGNEVSQVTCGNSHTMVLVVRSGQVFTFGDNTDGQLGYTDNSKNRNFIPQLVYGPWNSVKNAKSTHVQSSSRSFHRSAKINASNLVFPKQIFAGGNESLLLTSRLAESMPDFRNSIPRKKIFLLSDELVEKLQSLSEQAAISPDVDRYLRTVMGSSSCMNASFLSGDHHRTSPTFHGVDLMSARLRFSKLFNCQCSKVCDVILKSFADSLIPHLSENPPDIEALRVFLIIPECQLLGIADHFAALTIPFARKCSSLAPAASKVLDKWYRSMEPLYFCRPVDVCKQCLLHVLRKPFVAGSDLRQHMKPILDYLSKLNRINNLGESAVISYQYFYIPEIQDLVNLENDYTRWMQGHSAAICHYPFLLNSQAKSKLLQIDANYQMGLAYSEAQERNFASILGLTGSTFLETPVLELEVRRDELVQDALSRLASVHVHDFKKPLLVKFAGEEGQDAGGVRKEFFMLILKEVIDPKYGMFQYFDESRLIWLSDFELETEMMYFLVGLLCGLAIYNNTIIDICFPLALYKKLLGDVPTLSDLEELDPTTAKSLKQLLEYDQNNVEEVFCLDFTITRDNFGEVRVVELIPNGSKTAVNSENRKDFVNAYVDYIFNCSVRTQFEAFHNGFHKVCGGKIMEIFRPSELMEMVVGNQNYNWEDFEKSAQYKGEYYRQHPVIHMFWNVFHSFSLDKKKDFLTFLTGCNKVPINGIKITIQPVKTGDHHLPVAHTCFNLLDLPLYSSQSVLEKKLKLAIDNHQGFHLV